MRVCQFRHFGTVKGGALRRDDLPVMPFHFGLQMDCNTRVWFVESTAVEDVSSQILPCVAPCNSNFPRHCIDTGRLRLSRRCVFLQRLCAKMELRTIFGVGGKILLFSAVLRR